MGRLRSRGRRGPAPESLFQQPNISFDFVVTERPKYVPNSGPPLAPLTLLPVHDKDGVILEPMILFGRLRYIVGYADSPYLRIAVEPRNILDWVSPRTYETYGAEQSRIQEKLRKEEELRIIEAREARRIRKELKKAEEDAQSRGTESGKKRKRPPQIGRSRKSDNPKRTKIDSTTPRKPIGPGQRQQAEQNVVYFKSPKRSLHSQQQPSLSTPSRGLADKIITVSSSEDELALRSSPERLLNPGAGRFYISIPSSTSKTTSTEPPSSSRTPKFGASIQNPGKSESHPSPASKSRQSVLSQAFNGYPQITLPEHGGEAYMSSLDARVIYEDLERSSQGARYRQSTKENDAAQRFLATPQHALAGGPRNEDEPGEEVPEEEYEIRAILDDQTREVKGEKHVFYLIKWAGSWDDTWEPAENVGADAIRRYNKKKARARSLGMDGALSSDSGDCPIVGHSHTKVQDRVEESPK